ncbi:MAG: DUF2934 domain-containing protein [Devosia sp.]|uniref:DUF2934 domain-containing protein n=1 Tax=Devosia sp. TaxID=1871048 RepID=UPI0024C7D800|nr:DUF2934 domain-containing protein [Devosia sp.]UYN98187.1 MAG: DUF2934 domain-containing protein [Devosia sp.]
MQPIEDSKIRDRAYQLWVEAGQPEGREQEFWYEAERELAEEEQVDTSEEAAKLDLPPIVPGGMG